MTDQAPSIALTADIVSAFVSNNTIRAGELPELIATVHASFQALSAPKPAEATPVELKPAVPVRRSVTEDYIVSLEDGRKLKSMKRYLAGLGMTPDEYRTKWSLPRDYPMVAPGYAAKRSELAKATGLGSNRRKTNPAAALLASTALSATEDAAPMLNAADGGDGAAQPATKRRGRAAKKSASKEE